MKIIIVNDEGEGKGMDNSVCIDDSILKSAEDRETVKAKIEGTLIEHEGKRYISIETVDGKPVVPMGPGYGEDTPNLMDMSAEEALSEHMKEYE